MVIAVDDQEAVDPPFCQIPENVWNKVAHTLAKKELCRPLRVVFWDVDLEGIERLWFALHAINRASEVQFHICVSPKLDQSRILEYFPEGEIPAVQIIEPSAKYLEHNNLDFALVVLSTQYVVKWHELQSLLNRLQPNGVVLAAVDDRVHYIGRLVRDWQLRATMLDFPAILFEKRLVDRGVRRPLSIGNDERSAWVWPYRAVQSPLPSTLPNGCPWPRITVVTPSYNQGRYIEQTILSVINQGYPNLEYIVVDGTSSDETGEILAYYRDHFDHCIIEPDSGQSNAINKGMALASGEIVTWLNSDDMLAEGALAAVAMAFHTNAADMISGICLFQVDGRTIGRHMAACGNGPLPLTDLLDLETGWLAGEFFCQPEVFFRRSLWEKAGGYVREDLFYSMDYELWVRFAQVGARLHTIGRPLALYRVHPDQKTFDPSSYKPELSRVSQEFTKPVEATLRRIRPPVDYGRKLRIAMVNDMGAHYGAGIAMGRIAASLRGAGHHVWFEGFLKEPWPEKEFQTAKSIFRKIDEFSPDFIIIGNIHYMYSGTDFIERLMKKYPALWIAHDAWPVTGRCAYPGDCKSYRSTEGCDERCPTHSMYPALEPERIAGAFHQKLALYNDPSHPQLLCVSDWMAGLLRGAFVNRKPAERPSVETFRLGVDMQGFRPVDRWTARDLLGIPQNRFIVMFGACDISEHRKGGHHLYQALRELADLRPLLVTVGSSSYEPEEGLDIHPMGYVASRDTQCLLYSAADVYVGASLEEAFGQVFIEAAACGTPTVGYARGGVCEAIREGVTGSLVWEINPSSLSERIRYLHDNPQYRADLSAWARIYAENTWSLETSFRHLFGVLQRLGWTERFGMPHRIHMPALPV